jgi:xanthine dehydrogenase YagT iron-sulfur-binding subunit
MQDQRPFSAGGSHVSRRAFLKGSGAAAAATALATGTGVAEAADEKSKLVGPGATPIKLNVNGRERVLPVEPRTTLLEALRYKLNLTGAKPVSVDDSSGASMVIIDGKPASANTVFAIACVGKKIQTVESLGGDKPDAVPIAFLHNDAMQCGFCTPGFVVAVRAFLDKNPKATEKQIREGLNSNLCRCGTYANVIMAAVEVVKGGSRG